MEMVGASVQQFLDERIEALRGGSIQDAASVAVTGVEKFRMFVQESERFRCVTRCHRLEQFVILGRDLDVLTRGELKFLLFLANNLDNAVQATLLSDRQRSRGIPVRVDALIDLRSTLHEEANGILVTGQDRVVKRTVLVVLRNVHVDQVWLCIQDLGDATNVSVSRSFA